MPVWGEPTLSTSPRKAGADAHRGRSEALRLRIADGQPGVERDRRPPATYFTLAPAASTGGLATTDTLLLAGVDVVTPSLTDHAIVRLGLAAVGEAKVTDSSSAW